MGVGQTWSDGEKCRAMMALQSGRRTAVCSRRRHGGTAVAQRYRMSAPRLA
jgi:hypothetical protein